MNRVEKFAVALFGLFTALIVLPGLAFAAIAVFAPGAIDLGH